MSQRTNDTRLITIVLLIVGLLVVFPMLFMGFGMMGFGPTMGGPWGGGTWGDGPIPSWMLATGLAMQVLFLVALLGAGYLIYRAITGNDTDSDRAFEELRLAYARGELTDEEYEQRKDALERDT